MQQDQIWQQLVCKFVDILCQCGFTENPVQLTVPWIPHNHSLLTFSCSWTAQLLSDRPAVAVWLRGFKRLIDTSWVLWENREFTALQLRELLGPKLSAKKKSPVEVQTLPPKWGSNEVNSRSRTFNDSLGLSKILDINSLIIDTNELWSGCTVGL